MVKKIRGEAVRVSRSQPELRRDSTFEDASVDAIGFEGRPVDLDPKAGSVGKLDGGFAVTSGVGAQRFR